MLWFGLILLFSGLILWLGPLNPDGLPSILGPSLPVLKEQLTSQRPLHTIVFIPGIMVLGYHWWGRGHVTRLVEHWQEERRRRALRQEA